MYYVVSFTTTGDARVYPLACPIRATGMYPVRYWPHGVYLAAHHEPPRGAWRVTPGAAGNLPLDASKAWKVTQDQDCPHAFIPITRGLSTVRGQQPAVAECISALQASKGLSADRRVPGVVAIHMSWLATTATLAALANQNVSLMYRARWPGIEGITLPGYQLSRRRYELRQLPPSHHASRSAVQGNVQYVQWVRRSSGRYLYATGIWALDRSHGRAIPLKHAVARKGSGGYGAITGLQTAVPRRRHGYATGTERGASRRALQVSSERRGAPLPAKHVYGRALQLERLMPLRRQRLSSVGLGAAAAAAMAQRIAVSTCRALKPSTRVRKSVPGSLRPVVVKRWGRPVSMATQPIAGVKDDRPTVRTRCLEQAGKLLRLATRSCIPRGLAKQTGMAQAQRALPVENLGHPILLTSTVVPTFKQVKGAVVKTLLLDVEKQRHEAWRFSLWRKATLKRIKAAALEQPILHLEKYKTGGRLRCARLAVKEQRPAHQLCLSGLYWDELWERLYREYGKRTDRLQLPPVDFDYNPFRLYNKTTGEPYHPLTSPDRPEVMVAFPDTHPVGKYADVGLKIVNVHLWVLRDIILLLYRDRKQHGLQYELLPPGEAVRTALDRLHYKLRSYDYRHDEYRRAFRMARWYGEYVIVATNDYWLVRDYDSWYSHEASGNLVDGLPAEDRPYIARAEGWRVDPAVPAYVTVGRQAVLELRIKNYLPTTFDFTVEIINCSGTARVNFTIDGKDKNYLLSAFARVEADLPAGEHSILFEFSSESDEDRMELNAMKVDYVRFKSAQVVERPRDVNGAQALDMLIDMLLRYYELHHEGKIKGTRLYRLMAPSTFDQSKPRPRG